MMTDMAGFRDQVVDAVTDPAAPEAAPKASFPVAAKQSPQQPATTGVIDELLVGQLFLVQATIESASALGEGFQAARLAMDGKGDIGEVLKRTRRGVFEPYRDRYKLFRELPRKRQD